MSCVALRSVRRISSVGRIDRRDAFTLIELIVVVVILAALAAILIPRLGNSDRNAKLTAAVSNLNETMKFLEAFKVASQGKIPDGFDSLLSSAGTVYAGNGNPLQNSGVNASWLTPGVLTANELSSLRRISSNTVAPGGPTNTFITVYDHDTAAAMTNANASTDLAVLRNLDTTGSVAFVNPTSAQGIVIYRAFNLGAADPTNFRILAVGIGSHCTLVGRNAYGLAINESTIAGDPSPNSQFAYSRPIALIRVSDTTPQYFAEFIGTVNSYGKTASNIRTFIQ